MEASQVHMSKMGLFSGMSRVRPEMMQRVLHSAPTNIGSKIALEFPSTPQSHKTNISTMELFPSCQPHKGADNMPEANNIPSSLPKESGDDLREMTIFYNGSVKVLKVPCHKAEQIMKFVTANVENPAPKMEKSQQKNEAGKQRGGLAIVRKASLQRFLQKRKDRLNSVAPFPISKPSSIPLKPNDIEIQGRDLDLSLFLASHKTFDN